MKDILDSDKFQNNKYDLPIGLGKTISNEPFVADLAKMPHLLMAGATGQGKSVGLNAIIASLLYKKHPSELKFVLIDPKKVEFTLYSIIERHYLAMLPGADNPIITDCSWRRCATSRSTTPSSANASYPPPTVTAICLTSCW